MLGTRFGRFVWGAGLVGLVLVCAIAPCTQATAEDRPAPLRAGFAVVDLTPTKPVPLGGYGYRKGRLSEGVHDPVYARAAVFEQGESPRVRVALVSVDLVGVSTDIRGDVLAQVADLKLDALILAATHNHAGPGALTNVPLWKPMMGAFDAAFRNDTVRRIAESVREAVADLAPARLRRGRAAVAGMQRNRATPAGPVDPQLDVLAIDDPNGVARGVIVHFAAHPTILPATNMRISAGWPGVLCAEIERELPTATALFLNGAMGDVAPSAEEREGEDAFARMTRYGQALGKHALAAREKALPYAQSDEPAGRLGVTSLDLALPTVAAVLLGRAQGAALATADPIPLPMTLLRLGGVELVTVPGEPVHAVGDAMGSGSRRWVVSCAQDHVGYFADRELFRRGGYEADLSLFGPTAGEHLAGACDALARGASYAIAVRAVDTPKEGPVRIAGPHLGRRHGALLRDDIRDLLAAAETSLKKQVLDDKGLGFYLATRAAGYGREGEDLVIPLLVQAARRLQAHIPDEYLDEMEGIAAGARVPYDAILLENTFLTLAEQTDPTALIALPARCTNLVALGDATSMGQLLHASTLDWGMREVLKDRTRCLVVEPETGHPFVSITWPGMVGTLRAMGAQGIAITEESCAAKDDTGMDGMPINLLMRRAVQYSDCLHDAVTMLTQTPGTCGYKVTISAGRELDARVVEVTARRSHVRKPVAGLLFGCDPEAPEDCFEGECDPEIPRNDESSARRYPALRALLAQAPNTLRMSLVSYALASTEGGVLNDGTLLACIFEPQRGRFHVALGEDVAFEDGELHWKTHELLDLLSAEQRARYRQPIPVTSAGVFDVTPLTMPLPGVDVFDVHFDSPIPCGLACNDRIHAQLWMPKNPRGVLIQLPAWKERSLAAHKLLAIHLARDGIATFLLPMPYQVDRAPPGVKSGHWTLSANLARTRQAFIQGIADVIRASLWLEKEYGFGPDRQAVGGISLGGHAAALAFGAYPHRFRGGTFVLAGANIHEAFLRPNRITDRVQKELERRGVTPAEAGDLMRLLEPAQYADPKRKEDVLVIAATKDEVVAPENARALAAAYGGAAIHWLEGGHYAIIPKAGEVFREMGKHLTKIFEPD